MKKEDKEFIIGYLLDVSPRLCRYLSMILILVLGILTGNDFTLIVLYYICAIMCTIFISDLIRMNKLYKTEVERQSMIKYGKTYLARRKKRKEEQYGKNR